MSKTRHLLLAAAVSLASVLSAHAESPKKWLILPPVEYDRPYKGYLIRYEARDQAEIRRLCPNAPFKNIGGIALACTFVRTNDCTVYMVSDKEIRRAGLTPEVVLRHEIAHCNGWPGDHSGARWWWEGVDEAKAPQKHFLGDPRIWAEALRGTPVPRADPRKDAAIKTDLGRLLFGR